MKTKNTERFNIRLNQYELEMLECVAYSMGTNLSKAIRLGVYGLRNALMKQGKYIDIRNKKKIQEKEEQDKIQTELYKQKNNYIDEDLVEIGKINWLEDIE